MKPVVLAILDGWGISDIKRGNALLEANLPTMDKISHYYPCIALQASGISVGLPWGEPGNSEVGHMTIGTGKVIYQSLPRITMAIQSGEFEKNPSFIASAEHVKKSGGALHLIGLVGKGGVHSNVQHLYALLEFASEQKLDKVFLHVFTDGRDSAPTSGIESIKELQGKLGTYGVGKIATIGGRYFGMDRNNNWDRVEKSYATMVQGTGETTGDPIAYLNASYAKDIFDEYIEPAVIVENGKPLAQISDGDAVIFFNYREDRARQLTKAFVMPGFKDFETKTFKDLFFVTMVQYEDDIPCEVAFKPILINSCLGKILSANNLTQLRIAETEKFAHVTYFFNGGIEDPFPGEDRVIIPSKNVPNFAQAPEMSAVEITDKLTEFIEQEKYDFILVNYANADIVGHTGIEKAAILAAQTIDQCLDRVIKAVVKKGGAIMISADHGNAEEMINSRTGETDTEHSNNPVPFYYITKDNHRAKDGSTEDACRVAGLLSDIAPTILDAFNLKKDPDMTGESLLPLLK
jgi:2,3-bisphosphoglycerate-independent phosphoglycerate mutase